MKRTVLIETASLLAISILTIVEGLRLVLKRDPQALYDFMGPGSYVLVFGVALAVIAIAHPIVNYKKSSSKEKKTTVSKEMKIRVFGTIGVLLMYAFLINIFGYLVSTFIFFLLEMRMVGITSWRISLFLTCVFTAVFYFVFAHYGNMIFPRGLIFG